MAHDRFKAMQCLLVLWPHKPARSGKRVFRAIINKQIQIPKIITFLLKILQSDQCRLSTLTPQLKMPALKHLGGGGEEEEEAE